VVGAGYEIARLYFGQPSEIKAKLKAVTVSETDLKRFTGTYRSIRNFDVFGMELKDGKILSNGKILNIAHRDTLYLNQLKWVLTSPTKIMLINQQDTSSYVRVNPPDLNPNSLKAFTGTYFSEEADATFVIEVRGAEVWVIVKPGLSFKINPSFKDGFFTDEMELFEFKRDKKGNVTGFELSQSRAERVPFVKKK
jgi:hypothetical protein